MIDNLLVLGCTVVLLSWRRVQHGCGMGVGGWMVLRRGRRGEGGIMMVAVRRWRHGCDEMRARSWCDGSVWWGRYGDDGDGGDDCGDDWYGDDGVGDEDESGDNEYGDDAGVKGALWPQNPESAFPLSCFQLS